MLSSRSEDRMRRADRISKLEALQERFRPEAGKTLPDFLKRDSA